MSKTIHQKACLQSLTPSSVATESKQTYVLHVHSADMNAWIKSRGKKRSPSLYTEIRFESAVQQTEVIERKKAPSWDERFLLSGSVSSIISLSIKDHNWLFGRDTCIGHVDISLARLLAMCVDNPCAALEVKSAMVDSENLTTGIISVNLSMGADCGDYIGMLRKADELTDLGVSQGCRHTDLDQLGDIEASISNVQQVVELSSGGEWTTPDFLSTSDSQKIRIQHLSEHLHFTNPHSNLRKAVQPTDGRFPDNILHLLHLGIRQLLRFQSFGQLSDLDDSISNMEKVIGLTDDKHPFKPSILSDLGSSQHTRFELLGKLLDLETAIVNKGEAVKLTEDKHPNKPAFLSNLGCSQLSRFTRFSELSDLENATSNLRKAVKLTDDRDPAKPTRLSNLGNCQKMRFQHLGVLSDLERAMFNLRKAAELIDSGHRDKPGCLSNLGNCHKLRFHHLGELSDLENAMLYLQKAVELTNDEDPRKTSLLGNLGSYQGTRFAHLGKLSDLENALSNLGRAVELTDDGHESKPVFLMNLGSNQRTRFQSLSQLSDLENAILNLEKALELTDDRNAHKPNILSNLGDSQHIRFQQLGHLSDLENAKSNLGKAVELTDDRNPSRPKFLQTLGNIQTTRFNLIGQMSDLENAISNLGMAVEYTDDRNTDKPICLWSLGRSQHARFLCLGQSSDLENAISNLGKAVDLADDTNPNKPAILLSLGNCQKTCFERRGQLSNLENAISNLRRAAKLTDDRSPNMIDFLSNLGNLQQVHFEHLSQLSDLENSILNLQKAVELADDRDLRRPDCLSALGGGQHTRFQRLGNIADLENAISNLGKAVKLMDDGSLEKRITLGNLGFCQQTRFERLGELSDLENSISHLAKAVELTNDENHYKPNLLSNLGNSQKLRFLRLCEFHDLENAISNLAKAVVLTDNANTHKPNFLANLGNCQNIRFHFFSQYLGHLTDLENALSNLGKAAGLMDDGNHGKPCLLSNLGQCQVARFQSLHKLSDLENAISNQGQAVKMVDNGHPSKALFLFNLGNSQETRFNHLGELTDHVASVASFKAATQSKAAYPHRALYAARRWAETTHRHGNLQSALDGYRTALELLPKVAWLGLDASSRHDWLRREQLEGLGCLAATCAIQLGRFEEAVELLDLGRSVFWQQASSLRSDLMMLNKEAPELARELNNIGQRLDAGNFSGSFSTIEHQQFGVNSSEDAAKERRRLVDVWEKLVDDVRKLPRFKYFLRPIPFHQLRRATTGGQVVILNASEYGMDALIFGATGPIEHVPLSNIDLETLSKLSEDILLKRPVNGSTTQRQIYTKRFLKPALRIIWNHILIHIFDKLHIPLTDAGALPRRRIWWYPTGPLTFIPIHSAGPGNEAIDVSRLVISSYVTTLESLVQVRKKNRPVTIGYHKLLSVSQPDTPGQCSLPKTTEEVDKMIQVFRSSDWSEDNIVYLSGSEATVDRVSDALDACSWVHFACHGSQHPILGMKSAFSLHDGHLELGKIASKRLSTGQFAFLSACYAASGLEDLPGESMHLAAGLQFAGFPSVVATMWSICDEDAPKVAYHTYNYLFRNGLQGLDPSEAAMALNHAVLRLREDPNITVDRWAPFIHYGI